MEVKIILLKEISIMVPVRVKNIMWERLLRIIRSHRITYKIARYLFHTENILSMKIRKLRLYRRRLNREYKKHLKRKRQFYARIKQIDPDKYLDTSHKPNLNVIIITIDCLRNSSLSSQGYFRETTPFLDSFKSRFNAISAAPWTYPSVASILTGLYPHNHSAALLGGDLTNPKNFRTIRHDVLTLPEMLFLLGYRTYFGSANPLASFSVVERVVPKTYVETTKADDLLNDLERWIVKQRGKKFFTYVHLMDLHIPLNPPDSFRHFFGDVKNLPGIDRWDFFKHKQQVADAKRFQEYKWNRQLLYDNTLRYVDHAIKRFHESLEDMGLVDSTILVVTSDHGDELWDHAELGATIDHRQSVGHGHSVFGEIIEVPLLMSGPVPDAQPAHFVSSVDIVPTIVDLLGVTYKMRFDGQNIFETEGERPLLSAALAWGYEKKALVVGKYKLIYSKGDGVEWLFDLEKDPQEQHPIVDKEVTSIFVEKLHQILREDEKRKIREIAGKKSL